MLRKSYIKFWILVLSLIPIVLNGQTPGLIIKPGEQTVFDPNNDGYISADEFGFISDDLAESELAFVSIATVEAEPTQDPKGPACHFNDIVDTGTEEPIMVRNDGTNFIVRFRQSTTVDNAKGYSLLIDADGLFGAAEEGVGYFTSNPGFEIELTLLTKFGVYLNNIDNTDKGTVGGIDDGYYSDLDVQSPVSTRFQKSIALTNNCGDIDIFYEFYVPVADIEAAYPGFSTSLIRIVGLTTLNPLPTLGQANWSDLGGLDDSKYGSFEEMFTELIEVASPTDPDDLDGSDPAALRLSECPLINSVNTTANTISGTSSEPDGTIITIYKNAGLLNTTTVSSGSWTYDASGDGLIAGDVITATATGPNKQESTGCSNDVTVISCTSLPEPPITTGTAPAEKGLIGTYTGTVIAGESGDPEIDLFHLDGTQLNDGTWTVSDWTLGSPNDWVKDRSAGALDYGIYFAQSVTTCSSLPGPPYCYWKSGKGYDVPISIWPNIVSASETEVSGTITSSTTLASSVYLYEEHTSGSGVYQKIGSTSITPSTTNWTISGLNIASCVNIKVYFVEHHADVATASCQSESAVVQIGGTGATAPVITDNGDCAPASGVAITIQGTSTDQEGTIIKLYKNGSGTAEAQTGIVNSDGSWYVAGVSVAGNDYLHATATLDNACSIESSLSTLQYDISLATTNTGSIDLSASDDGIVYRESDTDVTVAFSSAFTGTARLYIDQELIGEASLTAAATTNFTLPYTDVYGNDISLYAGGDLTVTVDDGTNCESDYSASETVQCTPPTNTLILSPDPSKVCYNEKGSFTIENTQQYVVYTPVKVSDSSVIGYSVLSLADASNISVNTHNLTVDPTDITVEMMKISRFICESTNTNNITFNVNSELTAGTSLAADPTCFGGSNGEIVASATGGSGTGYEYQLDGGAWQTSATFSDLAAGTYTVSIKDDELCADDQTDVILADGVGACLINISIDDVALPEGDAGITAFDFTVTLDAAYGTDITVDYITNHSGINPTDAADHNAPSGTITILAGEKTATITVDVNGDTDLEPSETFTVDLSNASFGTIIDLQGEGTISNDDAVANNSPVLTNPATHLTNEDTPATFAAGTLISVSDVDGDTQEITISVTNGTLSLSQTTGLTFTTGDGTTDVSMIFSGTLADVNSALDGLVYTPTTDYNGTSILSVQTDDGTTTDSGSTTITINAVNDAPVANDDSNSGNEDNAVTVNVTTNDTDSDGTIDAAIVDLDPGTVGIQTTYSSTNGDWSVDVSGVVTFTPDADWNGIETITYTVNDNSGATSNAADIAITINAVNDAPVANDDSNSGNEDNAVTVNVTTNDTDSDGTIDAATVDLDPGTVGIQTTYSSTNGDWSVDVSGVVTFTPDADWNGIETITYTVNDNSGATSNAADIAITINAVNDAPVANDDSNSGNEDNAVTVNVTTNDTDSDGTIDAATVDLDPGTVGIQTTYSSTNGDWSVDVSGVVTFTPDADWNGIETITYTVNDNSGATSNAADIAITINAVNDAPVANDDSNSGNEDNAVTVNVTTNDTDSDGTIDAATVDLDPATVGIQTTYSSTNGDWSVDVSGVVTFTPDADWNGIETITYTVNDNSGATSNAADIAITINAVNDAPVANDDANSGNEDNAVTVNVTTNDTDSDGSIDAATVDLDPGTVGIQTTYSSTNGDWSVDVSGVVTFTPDADWNGIETITYTVNDNSGATSNAADIAITINAVNDAPVANDDSNSGNEDNAVTVNVTTNDTDSDGTIDAATVDLDPGTVGIQTTYSSTNGDWSVDVSGVVTFTPDADWNGIETITYTVNDNSGATSNAADIAITINAVNDAPVANDDSNSGNEDNAVTVNVTTNDTDSDGTIDAATVDLDPGTVGIQTTYSSTNGDWSVDVSGVVTFTPDADWNGIETITYTVNDNSGATSNAADIAITINAVNDAPVANDDSNSGNEDNAVTVNVTTNDTDSDGTIDATTVDLDPGTAGIQTTYSSTNGDWSVDASGVVTFTPDADWNGIETITYTVNDNSGATSNAANIAITINAVNDAPVANNDAASGNEDNDVTVNVTTNDTDSDGTIDATTVDLDPGTAGIQTTYSSTNGDWSVDASGVVTFTPDADWNGIETITYTVNDNSGATSNAANIAITINAVNDAPVAVNDPGNTTLEDTPLTINTISSNDIDIDGTVDPSTIILIDPSDAGNTGSTGTPLVIAGVGTYAIDASGTITFTPAASYNGSANVNYTIEDNNGQVSNVAVVGISVGAVNDAPVANNDAASGNEDNAVTVNVTTNDTDSDGTIDATTVDLDPGTVGIQTTYSSTNGSWSVDASGVVTFTPDADWNGTETISYTVNDNSGATSNSANIAITINAVNDAPVANNDAASGNEDNAVTVNVTTNDTDVDGTIDATTVDLDPGTAGIQTTYSSTNGSWSVDASGVVTFTPDADWNGIETITYTVNDNSGATSNAANIAITINAVNDAPVANNDAASGNEDNDVTVNVTTNDTDSDGTIDATTVDLDPGTAGIQTTYASTNGDWSVDVSGVVTFTPDADWNGIETITYTVNDNSGATSNAADIAITINAVNDAPVANDDSNSGNEDNAVTVNVTTNDTDSDGTIDAATVDLDPATVGIQTTYSSTNGDWSVDVSGVVTFTPDADWNGIETITYTVNDNSGATSNAADIAITINAVNDAPVAVNDPGNSTLEDTPLTINTIGLNDTDVDGTVDASTITLIDPSDAGNTGNTVTPLVIAGVGTYSINALGTITFTPVASYNGLANVNYTVEDNDGLVSNVALVGINVGAVNDAPVANDDSNSGNEDNAVTVNVTTNDTDSDGSIDATTVDLDPGTVGIQTTYSSTNGDWSVDVSGVVTFTPDADWNGIETITYTVNDNSGATSNAADIAITINAVNDAPVANDDSNSGNEDNAVTVNVTTNDTDSDGTIDAATVDLDPVTVGIQTTYSSTNGDWSVDVSGVVTFTPDADWNGIETITYTVNDNSGATSNAADIAITINAVNDAPVANDDANSGNEDNAVTVNVTTNDTDSDGSIDAATVDLDPGTVGIQTTYSSTNGDWSVDVSGVVTFTPDADWNGIETITYTVNDNSGATSNAADIAITINAVNDAPVANDDSNSGNEDNAVTVNVTTNDTDSDGTIDAATVDLDPATVGIQTTYSSTNGDWSVDVSGVVTFTPDADWNGIETITYTVNDNSGATSNAADIAITINAVNDAPVANDDANSGNEDNAVTVNVTTNDTDSDGSIDAATVDLDPGTVGIQTTYSSTNGDWSVDVSGVVTFTPDADWNGIETITYTVNDNSGATSNAADIAITINAVNDAPVANDDSNVIDEDAVSVDQADGSGTLIFNDTDVDLDALTVSQVGAETNAANNVTGTYGTINWETDGTYIYTLDNSNAAVQALNNGETLIETFAYTVNDGNGGTNTANLIITINGKDEIAAGNSDIVLTKVADDNTPDEGQNVTYTVTVSNNGPAQATSLVVTDALPAGLTLQSATPTTGTWSAPNWTVGTLNDGSTETLSIVATIDAGTAGTTITNTVSNTQDQTDDDTTTDDTSEDIIVNNVSDIVLTKVADDNTPDEGQNVTYTVTVSNNGPAQATNLVVSEALPAGLTFVSATPTTGTWSAPNWTVGTLNDGSTETLSIVATIDAGTAGTTITNTVSNTQDQTDDDTTTDDTSEDIIVNNVSDIVLTKVADDNTPDEGQNVTYTVTVSNNGPAQATNLVVSEALPAGLTFVSATPTTGTWSAPNWTVGTLNDGSTETLSIVATIDAGTAGTTITNTVSNTQDQTDDDTSPDDTEEDIIVNTLPVTNADIVLTKVVDDNTPDEGQNVTYTITVSNNGPAQATNLVVTDVLPSGLTLVSATPTTGNWSAPNWTVGTLNDGSTETLSIVATIDAGTAGTTITNTVSNTQDQTDDDTSPDDTEEDIIVNTLPVTNADIVLTKVVDDNTPDEGQNVTYTITVSNNGPAQATNLVVTDVLPSGLTLVSATPTTGNWSAPNWTVGTLNDGSTETLSIVATIDAGTAGTTITNTVSNTQDQTDDDTTPDDTEEDIIINEKITPEITTILSGGSNETTEDGTSDSFDLVLSAQPASDVVIDITGLDGTEGSLDKLQLTFSNGNWDVAQTITITGLNDDLIDGNITYSLSLTVNDANSDDLFDGLSTTVYVINIDNNSAQIITDLIGASKLTSEDGTQDYLDVHLSAQPNSDVVLDVLGLDITEGSLDKTQLIFTSSNWDVDQTITITGVDDDELDGDITYQLTLSVNNSESDINFNGLSVDVDVLNMDNETTEDEELLIPEGISPGDGQSNEEFYIEGLDQYDQASIKIYNRWGNLVYTDSDYKNDWTGKNNVNTGLGEELPSGTYFYLLEIKDNGKKYNGYVYLKRMNK